MLNVYGQSAPCPFVNAGPNQSFDCSQNCTNLIANFLDIRATNTYSVQSIPHTPPISYTQTGGTAVFPTNTDDIWSSVINLPFTFCFFGQQYSQILIGTNGNLSFNLSSAGGICPWNFSTGPANPNCPSAALVLMGNIFGVYHDVDPSKGSPEGTIKYYISGQAPCRIFTVVYNNLAHFGSSCSANTFRSTFMMALYETTNYIDVYVQRKDLCTAWNGGNSIIGIQNASGAEGIAALGRNTTPDWSVTTPEAWRFKPSGNPLYTFEWFQGTTSLGTNDTINVCPTAPTTYTAKYTYTQCGATTPTVLTDDVTITPAPGSMQVTSVVNPSVCGQANGSVTLSATGGSGVFEYSIDNVIFSTVNSYSGLSAGNYTFYVRDNNGCSVTYPVVVADQSTLAATFASTTNASCFGNADGAIQINATGGTQPYSFSLNGGVVQLTGIFTGLIAGQYQINITDAEGCSVQLDTIIIEPIELAVSLISLDTTSCNSANGAFEVTSDGGTGSLIYSIDAFSTQQSVGVFDSLFSNSFFLEVQDANGCLDSLTIFVPADSSVQASILAEIDITCNGANDGAISVAASVGPLPYTYSLNNGASQNFSVFSNLSPGNYTIFVSDANGCLDSLQAIVNEPPALVADAVQPPTICAGDTLNLIANISGGVPPYSVSWNGSISGNPAVDFPTTSSTYYLLVTDANGCNETNQIIVNVFSLPIADANFLPSSGYEPVTVVFTNESQNANSFQWDFGNGQIANATDLNPISVSYLNAGTYYVQLIASNDLCQNEWYDSVIVLPYEILEIEVPNVFSPNGDGFNEGYSVITKNATSIEAVIINRWGDKIVEIDDLNYKWDGKTTSGLEVADGVYFIKYKVAGLNNQEKQGHTFFHLIR